MGVWGFMFKTWQHDTTSIIVNESYFLSFSGDCEILSRICRRRYWGCMITWIVWGILSTKLTGWNQDDEFRYENSSTSVPERIRQNFVDIIFNTIFRFETIWILNVCTSVQVFHRCPVVLCKWFRWWLGVNIWCIRFTRPCSSPCYIII